MGITPPSLYSAFGDKEHLFLEAIEAYGKGPGGFGARALAEEPTARGAMQRLLEEGADELTRDCHPLGCMMVMAATNCSSPTSTCSARLPSGVPRRQEHGGPDPEGIDDGELPAQTDAVALANFYATVYQGMSMQAKDGASRKSLLATVKMAMASWPEPPARSASAKTASEPPRQGRDAGPARRPRPRA